LQSALAAAGSRPITRVRLALKAQRRPPAMLRYLRTCSVDLGSPEERRHGTVCSAG